MKIVRAMHYEIDKIYNADYFVNQEVAEQYAKEHWNVTDWGNVYYDELEVIE